MNKNVAIMITDGFEEGEAVVIIDILRRLEIDIEIISVEERIEVVSYHQVMIKADILLKDAMNQNYQAVVIVGGPQGSRALGENQKAITFLKKHIDAKAYICPFCSAGAHVLAKNNLWDGKAYVCSANNHELYGDGCYIDQDIVIDGQFISGKGLGLVFDFSFTIASLFVGYDKIDWQAEHIYYHHWKSSDIKHYRVTKEING